MPDSPVAWPKNFSILMDACYAGKYYDSAGKSDSFTVFRFSDGSTVSISKDEMRIVNSKIDGTPEIKVGQFTGEWTVNKVLTGVKSDKSLRDEDSAPLCIFYDPDCVYIALGKGKTLAIGCTPDKFLTSFAFHVSDNIELKKGIICGIDGFEVTGERPTTLANLVALQGNAFDDPDEGYAMYINVESFINNFIVKEVVKDIDGNLRKSSFLT